MKNVSDVRYSCVGRERHPVGRERHPFGREDSLLVVSRSCIGNVSVVRKECVGWVSVVSQVIYLANRLLFLLSVHPLKKDKTFGNITTYQVGLSRSIPKFLF